MKKVTVIGGGTGSFVVLSGLKSYPIDLAVVVTMMDSGGSTGKLRDQLGVLPPGDLRQCLVALSETSLLWRKLFLYRFEEGDLSGHNFGNIFISALEKVTSNYDEVIKTASYVLKTKGKVIPVTFNKTNLCAEYSNGKLVFGETKIDENNHERSRIIRLFLDPQVEANNKALLRLKNSHYIIIGPGDLYTSIIPILLVNKVKEAIQKSKAKIIYNLNLMTKSGQTYQYTANDHIRDLTKYLEREPDFVVINNGEIKKEIIDWYADGNEIEVKNDLSNDNFWGTIINKDLIDNQNYNKSVSDRLTRSILRHNPKKLAKVLASIII